MKTETHQLFENWFDRVWKNKDDDAIYEMFPDGKAEGFGSQKISSPEEFREFRKMLSSLVDDIDVSIDKCVESEGWTALLCVMRGRSASTGDAVTMTGSVFAQVENDKIIQAYNHWNFNELWEQLGLHPKGAFLECLCGKKLCYDHEDE